MFIHVLYYGFKLYCFIFHPIRMGVRVLMTRDGKVWLVRHTYQGGWFLPGGGLNKNETLDEAAHREAWEETGAKLGTLTMMGAYSNFVEWKSDHTVVFVCREFEFTGKPDGEIAELREFDLNHLPQDIWPGHRRRLLEFQAGIENPQFGTW